METFRNCPYICNIAMDVITKHYKICKPQQGLSILMHDIISLPDAKSYDMIWLNTGINFTKYGLKFRTH